jgi:hypothetical protein
MVSDSSRLLVRIRRSNRAALNPDALGELLYRDLLEYDPACREVLVELDGDAVRELADRQEYEIQRVADLSD